MSNGAWQYVLKKKNTSLKHKNPLLVYMKEVKMK